MIHGAIELAADVGVAQACQGLGVSRATLHRRTHPHPKSCSLQATESKENHVSTKSKSHTRHVPRKLSGAEHQRILDILHAPRFVDQSPAAVYATLLEEGEYAASIRTMYRVLAQHGEVKERRNQARRVHHPVPRLVAHGPKQVFTWDITKIHGPAKGIIYSLYVIIDLYSRYVVGWLIADRESAELAKHLIHETCDKHGITPDSNLVIHADRGSPMKSKAVSELLRDLAVDRSHSRPRVSNDNAFSEAAFKTIKYHHTFPSRFDSLADAESFFRSFFNWYNQEHRHSGIALMTPADVFHGRADAVRAARAATLARAHAAHPERFVNGPPSPATLPEAVWINRPDPEPADLCRH